MRLPFCNMLSQALAAQALFMPMINGAAVALRGSELSKREPSKKFPSCAPPNHLKFQPAMDFDRDGCYNTPAIGPEGNLNPGISVSVSKAAEGGCRDPYDLNNNNVYSRARCNNGWCAYIYAYYFEKDQSAYKAGHRHDWEHVVVWTQNGQPKWVGASAHGSYNLEQWDDVLKDGTHPKIVYHKDGVGTHAMRFANGNDEPPENHTGKWFRGDLVGWLGFPSDELRNKMANHDWDHAHLDISDANFVGALQKAQTFKSADGRLAVNIAEGFDRNVDAGPPPSLDCGTYP